MPLLKTFIDARRFQTTLKEKVDPAVCVTELVRCRNADGRAFYAYIRLKPSEYMGYKSRLESGQPVNPNDYEIVEYGWGEDPPQHVQEIMEEKHGVDHDFSNKIKQLHAEAMRKIAV